MSSSAPPSSSIPFHRLLNPLWSSSSEKVAYIASRALNAASLFPTHDEQDLRALRSKVLKTSPESFLGLLGSADESYFMQMAAMVALSSIDEKCVDPDELAQRDRRRRIVEIMLKCDDGSCSVDEGRKEILRLAEEERTKHSKDPTTKSGSAQSDTQKKKAEYRRRDIDRNYKAAVEAICSRLGSLRGTFAKPPGWFNFVNAEWADLSRSQTAPSDKPLEDWGVLNCLDKKLEQQLGTEGTPDTSRNNVLAPIETPPAPETASHSGMPEWYESYVRDEKLAQWFPSLHDTEHSATVVPPSQNSNCDLPIPPDSIWSKNSDCFFG